MSGKYNRVMKRWLIILGRTILPLGVLAAMLWLFKGLVYPLPPETPLLLWLSRLDPLLLLAALRLDGLPEWWWLPATVITVTILWGRLFCGWLCPLGGLLHVLHNLRFALVGRQSRWNFHTYRFHPLGEWRWYWLVLLLGLLAAGSNWPLLLTPFHLLTQSLYEMGQNRAPYLLIVPVVLGLLIYPRFWCVYLCPTGLLLSGLSRWRRRGLAMTSGCVGCGRCRQVCPMQAANPAQLAVSSDCITCLRCTAVCPAAAIVWQSAASAGIPEPSLPGVSRRVFLMAAAASAGGMALGPAVKAQAAPAVLRPPGALRGTDFALSCSRCGRCLQGCPSQCLQPMPAAAGLSDFLTPRIMPRQARCELCFQCQEVCPTGAIQKVPVEQVRIGLAHIKRRECIAWTEGKLCLVCREQCPLQAVDMDRHQRPSINEKLCVGCGACENSCPLEKPAVVVKAHV